MYFVLSEKMFHLKTAYSTLNKTTLDYKSVNTLYKGN